MTTSRVASMAWGALLIQFALAGRAIAQLPAQPDSLVQKYRADYAVPDAPALTMLQLDESSLLRPSTVRELAVAVSDFTGAGGGLQLPKAAAVEFSPGLLFFGRRLKLQDYQNKAALYRLRVSVASRRAEAEGSPTQVALAVRTSFKDAADLRDRSTNPAFFEKAKGIIARAQEIDAAAEDAAAARGGINEPVVYNPEQQQELNQLIEEFKALNVSIADTAWNRTALDVAVGLRADARDSTGNDLSLQQVAGWITYGGRIGTWGQLMFGAKMGSVRDSVSRNFEVTGTAASRLYAGANRRKVYLDLQGSKRGDEDTELVLTGGAEVNVTSGVWVVLSLGTQWNGGADDGRFRARFSFKSGFPMQ
jgi:hypothetical protein